MEEKEEQEEKEEKEVYRERPDLVAALEEKYFRPFELSNRFEGYESDSFAEIMSISEVVGERAVKLMLRVVSFGSTVKYSGITTETEFPWWMFKKNADDELTADMVMNNMNKIHSRDEFVEFARKRLKQFLQVVEDMGIHKEEILR